MVPYNILQWGLAGFFVLLELSIIIIIFVLLTFTSITKAWIDTPLLAAEKVTKSDCTIELVNNTNKYYVFWLSWIDHPHLLQTKGKPWTRICAEMEPGESFISSTPAGLYTVTCRERWKPNTIEITKNFTIRPETIKIVITIVMVSPMDIPIIILKSTLRPVGGSKPD